MLISLNRSPCVRFITEKREIIVMMTSQILSCESVLFVGFFFFLLSFCQCDCHSCNDSCSGYCSKSSDQKSVSALLSVAVAVTARSS